MKKQEIIEKLKSLHDHSHKFMRYSELIREGKKDYLDKKSQIDEWIKEEDEHCDSHVEEPEFKPIRFV